MKSWEERTLIEDVLANGVDDWVYAGWVAGISARVTSDPAVIRHISIGLIAELLLRGWMVAGDVLDDAHAPWQISIDAAIERIAREWVDVGDAQLHPGQIVWLANTAAGDLIGNEVLTREAAHD